MGMLDGKVSLITSVGNGIGRGIALRFAHEGSAVGVLDIQAALDPAIQRYSSTGQSA